MSLERLRAALSDRYTIERELGAGGMATVYLAEDLKHKRKVALKVLKPELAAVLGAERFVQEITTTAALQHPHILPLFDSGESDGFLWYAMPFIDGETLREKLNRETQLSVDEAVKLTSEVADALHYAHTQGVVHRDIKPENILLANGRPMVADFGIALALSAAAGGRMTETGMSLGTPHYMSPEQATAEKEISGRSDIYSLASVCYEMLAGQPPHLGGSAQQIIMKIIAEPVEPVTRYRKSVPPNVAAALAKALEKLPADRFATAKEFADALGNRGFTTGTTAIAGGVGAMGGSYGGARRLLPWGLAVAGIAAAVATWTLRPNADPAPPIRFAIPLEGGGLSMGSPGHHLALSTDGQVVVYASEAGGVPVLYRRRLGDLEASLIAGSEGGFQPVLSPDGRWVGFSTRDGLLKRVEVEGGAPTTLARTTTPIGMTWSAPFGLVLGMPLFSDSIWGLTAVPFEGTANLVRVTDLLESDTTSFTMHHDPIAVADGATILYVDIRWRGGTQDGPALGIVDLAEQTTTRVDLPLNNLVGLADDILVYRGRDNSMMAVRLDLPKRAVLGTPIRLDVRHEQVKDALISANGTLAMLMAPAAFEMVIVDQQGRATAILPDTVRDMIPRFSPDGRQAILSGRLRGASEPWMYDFATSSLTRLGRYSTILEWNGGERPLLSVPFAGRQVYLRALTPTDSVRSVFEVDSIQLNSGSRAPGSRTLALGVGVGQGEFDIMLATIDDAAPPVPFAATRANEIAPRFSPDGRWLAYASDESGRYEVYVRPVTGPGARVQVSDQGGGQPVWARDGRTLYYRSGRAMVAADLVRGGTDALTVTGRRALFEGEFADPAASQLVAAYDVAPDGRFLMMRALGGSRAEIVVWLNWLNDVKAQLDAQ